MKVEKINNYLTFYKECNEEEIELLYLGNNTIADKLQGEDPYRIEAFDNKAQCIINNMNGNYELIEVVKGKYVKDALVGLIQELINDEFLGCDEDLEEVALPYNTFIEALKTYMAVCCSNSEKEIRDTVKFLSRGKKENGTIVTKDNTFSYEFIDGTVYVYGSMVPLMSFLDIEQEMLTTK